MVVLRVIATLLEPCQTLAINNLVSVSAVIEELLVVSVTNVNLDSGLSQIAALVSVTDTLRFVTKRAVPALVCF